jgi:hypothetical protein
MAPDLLEFERVVAPAELRLSRPITTLLATGSVW